MALLFLPIYFFAGIGQSFWGGQLQVENNPEIADTDYIGDSHQIYNFNDMIMGVRAIMHLK
jgi:hypothetical protein